MDLMRYVFHMCTMNTSFRVNFIIVSKSMCIHMLGDSNTKYTHLGGVHPMVCDFETNMFSSLFFVVSYWAMTYWTKFPYLSSYAMSSCLCSPWCTKCLWPQRLSIGIQLQLISFDTSYIQIGTCKVTTAPGGMHGL